MTNEQLPREEGLDHTLALLNEGYEFIMNRRRNLNADAFETHILGKNAVCMSGRDAAELFYDEKLFKREGAAPKALVKTLFGENAVQTLDGDEHKERKEMLMSIMDEDNNKRFKEIAAEQWEKSIDQWCKKEQIVFYEEMKTLLGKVACLWAGFLIEDEELKWLVQELSETFEFAGAVGPSHLKARTARSNVEKWMVEKIEKIREGKLVPPENTALHKFSFYKDKNGNLLDSSIVAVEVLNIYRPMIAIAIYINFIVLALLEHPNEMDKLQTGNEEYKRMFVDEVRRYYPFFPFVAAKVKEDFTFKDRIIKKDTLAFLDLYGTNHDENLWMYPEEFNPNRFADYNHDRFSFIPQGGGDYLLGHRCAGEQITIEMMKISLDFLVNRIEYDVPEQDLSFEMNKMPTIPQSNIIMKNIKRKLVH